jgi:phosphonate transport system permease protein
MSNASSIFLAFFPPNLSPHYLLGLVPPLVETVGMACAAMFATVCISLPLGIAAALEVRGASAILKGLAVVRAVPDLTLAVLCVILFGVGPGAGVVALAIYYSAAVSKMFADILRTAPRGPLEALRSTGASRLQVALYGLVPLRQRDLLSYGAYEFESVLRASVVVGAVGGGGLGSELVGSLSALDFPRVTTQILALVILIAGFDTLAVRLRRRPQWLAVLFPVGLLGLVAYSPHFMALGHAAKVFGEMVPPQMKTAEVAKLPTLILETLWMAVAGTAGAVAAALILAPASARNLAPAWLALPVRRVLEVLRTVPEVVWGLVLITAVGVGPVAGAWALGLHSAGSLGRLFAESLENAPCPPQWAIEATGAGRLSIFAYATAPLSLAPIAAHALFRLEWNMRMATVMGLIGAGGIGQALFEAQQLFFYRQMLAYILITALLVAAFDRTSEALRRRHGLLQGAPT